MSLDEWSIPLTAARAKAGTVRFTVRNEGAVAHDLVVVQVPVGGEFAANRLPTVSGIVDESRVTIVGRTAPLTPGEGKEISIAVTRGACGLICNVIGHYNSGQFVAFTVE